MVVRQSMHRVKVATATTVLAGAWTHVAQKGKPVKYVVRASPPFVGADHVLAMLVAGIRSAHNGASSMVSGVGLAVVCNA